MRVWAVRRHGLDADYPDVAERLTSLDGSFLRIESANAHMHVAWSAVFKRSPKVGLEALRRGVAARLERTPRFRRRLAYPAPGLGEPYWVDDPDFDVTRHVVRLGPARETLSDEGFAELCDHALSEQLDRSHPLWRMYLAPRLAGGRCALVAKIHHSLVDGKSAVEVAQLLFDVAPEPPDDEPSAWSPRPQPSRARLSAEAVAGGAGETLRAARSVARAVGTPRSSGGRIAGTLRRAALAVGDDLLRPAPSSYLNVSISPRRTLARHSVRLDVLRSIKQAAGVSLNDVCLALVAGALRDLALQRGRRPQALKTMVPVSVRDDDERTALGNRISLAFVELPVHERTARRRLEAVHAATAAFKRDGRPGGTEAVLGGLGLLPSPLRGAAARAVGSPRVYNLTVSNIPGPDFPLYMLGAELLEAHPVVPIAEGHSLSIGIFSYRGQVFFGLYADPETLPEVRDLPLALGVSLLALQDAYCRASALAV